MEKLFTADRETGTFIEEIKSVKEGKELIAQYEEQDKIDGTYEENFYCIVDENHITVE
jgi:hypothetical protein